MEVTNSKKVLLIIVIIVLIVFFIVKMVYDRNNSIFNSGLNGEYSIIYKKYGVNEYSAVSISDEQLANIYLNNFKYYLFNDIDYAYSLLDEDYRNIKFVTIDSFRTYVNDIDYKNFSIKEYRISDSKKFIEVNTLNDYKYIFKIDSILDYKVYMDDYTVEISIE